MNLEQINKTMLECPECNYCHTFEDWHLHNYNYIQAGLAEDSDLSNLHNFEEFEDFQRERLGSIIWDCPAVESEELTEEEQPNAHRVVMGDTTEV